MLDHLKPQFARLTLLASYWLNAVPLQPNYHLYSFWNPNS